MQDAKGLKKPPVPVEVDLRKIGRMQLDILALLSSETMAMCRGEKLHAALTLWIRAFHQVPAGSLPNDENVVMSLAGYSSDPEGWQRVKAVALKNFELHNDGRLYHTKLSEVVLKTWKWWRTQKGLNDGTEQGRGNQGRADAGDTQFGRRLRALGRAAGRS